MPSCCEAPVGIAGANLVEEPRARILSLRVVLSNMHDSVYMRARQHIAVGQEDWTAEYFEPGSAIGNHRKRN